jgi:hypothetical protein
MTAFTVARWFKLAPCFYGLKITTEYLIKKRKESKGWGSEAYIFTFLNILI